jgi:uracil-DNA glycosylase
MADDIRGFVIPKHGLASCILLLAVAADQDSDLTEWAKHGVLLLNTSLTVKAHQVGP